jgi:hypothetical protein
MMNTAYNGRKQLLRAGGDKERPDRLEEPYKHALLE